jgi:archaellum biogenesis ATPase FlaH
VTQPVKDLAVAMAEAHYNFHQELVFKRITFSKTDLGPKTWKDASERDRLEFVEAMRKLLADQRLMEILRNRAEL